MIKTTEALAAIEDDVADAGGGDGEEEQEEDWGEEYGEEDYAAVADA